MIIPVILCGGSGTRLWPLSRTHMPKQLQAVVGGTTMLQQTAVRLNNFSSSTVAAPIVVCNDSHRYLTRRQLTEIGITKSTLIAEPMGRNTAPALTLAALTIDDPNAVMVVMPADQVIPNDAAFIAAAEIAVQAAESRLNNIETIVTFGVVPTAPATGYGYLHVGSTSSAHPAAFNLSRFIEKPDLSSAKVYLAEKSYLWNSGLFVVRAGVWLRAMQALAPAMLAACETAFKNGQRVADDILPAKDDFAACPADSIDYAIMEKLPSNPSLGITGAIVPLDAGWSDVGAWDSVWDVEPKDASGNVSVGDGDVMFENTKNTYVRTSGPNAPAVACVGIENMIVVQTPDAILIANKDRAQDVKTIATKLSANKDSRADLHRKVHRPWGWYDSLGSGPNGAGFQVKHIGVYPGQSLSLQYHHKRAEHWVVVKGVATITVGESVCEYRPNEHVFIPLGDVHRLENKTNATVEIVELQLGAYLGEDDIVRLQDNYSRV